MGGVQYGVVLAVIVGEIVGTSIEEMLGLIDKGFPVIISVFLLPSNP